MVEEQSVLIRILPFPFLCFHVYKNSNLMGCPKACFLGTQGKVWLKWLKKGFLTKMLEGLKNKSCCVEFSIKIKLIYVHMSEDTTHLHET